MKKLTKTQTLIVQLLSDGFTQPEVAEYRCRSLGTVRKHIELARERMGARSTGHLIKLAVQQGLIRSFLFCLIFSQAMPAQVDRARVNRVRTPVAARRVAVSGRW